MKHFEKNNILLKNADALSGHLRRDKMFFFRLYTGCVYSLYSYRFRKNFDKKKTNKELDVCIIENNLFNIQFSAGPPSDFVSFLYALLKI